MKRSIFTFLGICILISIYMLCWLRGCNRCSTTPVRDTTVFVDTVVVYDTITIDKPQVRDSIVLRYVPVKMPLVKPLFPTLDSVRKDSTHNDSVSVVIPIEQVHYGGEDYDAWVSGYHPQLDSLNIYRPTSIITENRTITETRWRTKRWGLSIGTGLVASPRGVAPGVFVGFSYNLFSWPP